MKKSTLLKLALFLVAIFIFAGAQAQTVVNVYKIDGSAAVAPTIFSVNLTTGVETAVPGGVAGNVITTASTLTVGTTYAVYAGTERRSFVFAAGPVTIKTAPPKIGTAGTGDYVQTATTTFQTKGKKFRLYVAPDPIFSPSYLPLTNANVSANSKWTWTYATLTGDIASTVLGPAQQNWIEFSGYANASAVIPVSVAETNTLSGCASTTPVSQNVQIVETPDATLAGPGVPANVGAWTVLAGTPATEVDYKGCISNVTNPETLTMTITEDVNIPTAFRAYAFKITTVVDNMNSDLTAVDVNVTPSSSVVDYTTAAKLGGAVAVVPGTHTWNASTLLYTFPTAALTVQNNKPTRYTYTIAGTGALTGIASAISQKSDYLDASGYAYGLAGVVTVRYIVLPQPVTGPIYHISNSFAL